MVSTKLVSLYDELEKANVQVQYEEKKLKKYFLIL